MENRRKLRAGLSEIFEDRAAAGFEYRIGFSPRGHSAFHGASPVRLLRVLEFFERTRNRLALCPLCSRTARVKH